MDVWGFDKIREDIKENRDELSSFLLDYLNCLVDLEFSVLRNYINDRERSILQNTEIYKQVCVYNLLYRTLYLIESNLKVKIFQNSNGYVALSTETSMYRKVFEFYHVYNKKFKIDYCHLSIFQLIPDRLRRLNILKERLDSYLLDVNPYPREMTYASSIWIQNHNDTIDECIRLYDKLKDFNYSDDEIILIDLMEKLCNILFEDFSIKLDEFGIGLKDEIDDDYSIDTVLIKKYSNTSITWNGKVI